MNDFKYFYHINKWGFIGTFLKIIFSAFVSILFIVYTFAAPISVPVYVNVLWIISISVTSSYIYHEYRSVKEYARAHRKVHRRNPE